MGNQRRMGSIIVGIAVMWAFGAIALAAMFWPRLPHSIVGWLAFVLFGPLLYFLAAAISDFAGTSRAVQAFSNYPSSAARIVCGVVIGAVVLAVSMGISWFITHH